jgi:Domain of unknown function (DUF4252)
MKARVAIYLTALLLASPALAQINGQLRLPQFAALTDKATESVTVTLDSQLLGLGCRFLSTEEPDEAAAKKLCSSLTGIYVRSFTFDKDYAYPKADIDGLRNQLKTPGWSPVVEAYSRKKQTNVEVYVHIEGGKAKGLAIISSEPREFAIVNIVGNIDLEQLHDLEGKFSIPELGIETGKKPAVAKPSSAPATPAATAPKKN